MSDLPPLTLLLGPQTDMSLGLNAVIRDQKNSLLRAGVNGLPSRFASPILRRAVEDRSIDERAEKFATLTADQPLILSALNFFGPPHAGMAKGEMFPEAEASLARLAEITPNARIVLSVDTLPAFFLAAGSEALETRVQRTSWEVLYEMRWSDLAYEIKAALPESELVVLVSTAAGSASAMQTLLGAAAPQLPDLFIVLRKQLSESGRAVLDRLQADGHPCDEGTMAELYHSFAKRPSLEDMERRLGIDKLTASLLEQRFDEDLDTIRAMPGTVVLA